VNFETYLISKRIDSAAFRKAEPELWNIWENEFEQMHPESFTMQKLNLINPIRRKYTLQTVLPKVEETSNQSSTTTPSADTQPTDQTQAKLKPSIPKPVFKPKPKMS
jgi:hypothetical protein